MGHENAVMRLKAMAESLWADAFRGQNGIIYGFRKRDLATVMQYNAKKYRKCIILHLLLAINENGRYAEGYELQF